VRAGSCLACSLFFSNPDWRGDGSLLQRPTRGCPTWWHVPDRPRGQCDVPYVQCPLGVQGRGDRSPLGVFSTMRQGEGKGATGNIPALPLAGAVVYGVAIWGRLWCQLALGSAGWLSLLSLRCDLPGRGHTPAWEGRVPLPDPPQAAELCLAQPGEQVLCSPQGLSGEGDLCSCLWRFPRG